VNVLRRAEDETRGTPGVGTGHGAGRVSATAQQADGIVAPTATGPDPEKESRVTIRLHPATWGVRVRSTMAAVVVVTVAFAVASLALLWVLRASLESSTDAASRSRAADIVAQLRTDAPADLDRTLLATTGRTSVVQVLDAGGAVLVASEGAPSEALSPALPPGATPRVGEVRGARESADYRVVAEAAAGPTGTFTVVVAAEQDPVSETLSTVAALLALGVPVVVVVVGAATYLLVGRSLRPVERMRGTVSAISTADLSDRLAVPATHDEIARLAVTLNSMLGRIEHGHTAQRRFVGDASHELRSPLSTLTAALELGAERPGFLDVELVRDRLLPEAQRMQHLVDDLLLLARADERGLALRVVDVDLDDILDAEVIRVRAGATVGAVSRVHPTQVRGDAVQLVRMVRNLVDNAVRHAVRTIVLGCTTDGDHAVITVSDDGAGIPAPDRARVLERFVRLDTDRARSAGGSGLGLAIVAEIVAAHGGTVVVGESDGGGARVTVRLPLAGPAHPPVAEKR
jgi:two-component system OmpR family sensor kinase